jgi:uncharacterized protein YegP (UPF0339 family)
VQFVIWKSKNDQYYWELVADNGETVAVSETYTRKASAKETIESIKQGASEASVLDCTDGSKYDRNLP